MAHSLGLPPTANGLLLQRWVEQSQSNPFDDQVVQKPRGSDRSGRDEHMHASNRSAPQRERATHASDDGASALEYTRFPRHPVESQAAGSLQPSIFHCTTHFPSLLLTTWPREPDPPPTSPRENDCTPDHQHYTSTPGTQRSRVLFRIAGLQ